MRKLLVVSGGTKGIGKAIAQKFAAEGFNIATCSRKEKDLEALKTELTSKFGIEVFVKKADLSQKNEVGSFIEFVKGLPGKVEVLVNNTGVFIPGQIHAEEDGVLEKMIDTNLYSAYYLTRGLIGDMITSRQGYIFNICSIASITPYPNGGSYSISKYAMYGMTKVLREEMKEYNVKVSAILPGATLTASWEGINLPADRFMKAEDVGNIVFAAYSLSPGAVMEDIVLRPQLGDIK
jgi:short-subunit dehydrogenase